MEKGKTLEWIFRIVVFMMLSVGGWFATQIWNGQKDLAMRLNAMDVDRATVMASRFTAMDWVSAKAALDAQFNATDRRVLKLENFNEQITRSLEEIKQNTRKP